MFTDLLTKRQLKQCAEDLRKAAGSRHEGDILPRPVTGCEALGKVGGGMPVLSWMYFNPLGPTSCGLFFVAVPQSQDLILALNSLNPFEKNWTAYLLAPGPLSPKMVVASLGALFVANGHSAAPLFSSLPTSVFHADNWSLPIQEPLLGGPEARGLFRLVAPSISDPDFETTNEFLRQYKGNPWERTAAELQEGPLQSLVQTDHPKPKFDAALFEEWFDLVTDPEHVRSEQSNFQAAWQGAVENAQGKYR
jgi:hypothetical protein